MARETKSKIKAHPLGDLGLGQQAAPSSDGGASTASQASESAPTTPPTAPEAIPRRKSSSSASQDSASSPKPKKKPKKKMGFYMTPEDEAQAVITWSRTMPETGHRFITNFYEEAVMHYVKHLENEHNKGKPFK